MSECTNGEMRDLLPELVNERLSAEMQLAVEAHVAECEECAEELALLRALRPALMREPAVDTQRIVTAVRAQAPASARRGSSRSTAPWRLAIAAAALLAVSAIGYAMLTRARSVTPEVAAVPQPDSSHGDSANRATTPSPAPAPVVATPRKAIAPTPPQQVAGAPPPVVPPATTPSMVASAGMLDNLSDLSDDDVRTLTASLDGLSAVPDAEPAAGIDPLGASLDDQSGGGN
jgi:anti-sigma factor RsiW